jgi:hypothetical protein
MTQSGWLACTRAAAMLEFLRGWQLVPVEVAYRAAVEYLYTPARPQSVRRFDL